MNITMASTELVDDCEERNNLIAELDMLEDQRAETDIKLAALLEVLMAQEGEIVAKKSELEVWLRAFSCLCYWY